MSNCHLLFLSVIWSSSGILPNKGEHLHLITHLCIHSGIYSVDTQTSITKSRQDHAFLFHSAAGFWSWKSLACHWKMSNGCSKVTFWVLSIKTPFYSWGNLLITSTMLTVLKWFTGLEIFGLISKLATIYVFLEFKKKNLFQELDDFLNPLVPF